MNWLYQLAALLLLVLSWFYSSTITYLLIGTASLLVVFFTWFEIPFLDNLEELDEANNERTD